jgi:eukaryotic-like serine/threonine-protein kinase
MSDDLVGRTLANRFEIVSLVGQGGMASVYEAHDTLLDRTVALKLFTLDAPEDRSRLEIEVRLLSRLNHPNLVTVHDAHIASGADDGPSFLVMEFVRGKSLRDAASDRQLSAAEIATVAEDIASALTVVHDAGIIHRDVKPANILIEQAGAGAPGLRAKLADFGIAHTIGSTRLTAVGTVIGSAAYLSPEQAEGADVTIASDIYSLGLVLLELWKGAREYPGPMAESLAARISRDPVLPDSLSADWSNLLERMLARDPGSRPAAASVVRAVGKISDPGAGEAVESATALMPTVLLPTARLAASDVPDPVSDLPSAATPPPASSQLTVAMGPPAQAAVPRSRTTGIRIAVAAAIVLAVVLVVLALQLNAPASVTPAPSQSNTSTSSPSVTPSTTPIPAHPTPPAPPGKGDGNDKGPGNGHGKGNGD